MKVIGLIGGMSWESTAVYYKQLNELAKGRFGGLSSAELLVRSVDFSKIVELQQTSQWAEAGKKLNKCALELEAGGAEVFGLCTNTMHKVSKELTDGIPGQFVDIIQASAEALLAKKVRKVLLLGTRFTMEDGFYTSALGQKGVEASVPEPDDRAFLHKAIFEELCLGEIRDETRKRMRQIVLKGAAFGLEGVLLACTELGLLVTSPTIGGCSGGMPAGSSGALVEKPQAPLGWPLPIFDTTLIHCEALFTAACSD